MMDTDQETKIKPTERCDWRSFLAASDETSAETIKAFDHYFSRYAAINSPCPGCGRNVFGSGDLAEALTATFRWGIVHGEGHCCNCGWPATLYHFIKNEAGEEIATLRNIGLVYHPDVVSKRGAG